MTLLSFPPTPVHGQLYPPTPVVGENQYRWDSPDQTWKLLGPSTGVTPGCYGDEYTVPRICVDANGRLTFAENVTIAVTGGTVTDVTAGTGLSGGTITSSGTISLDTAYTDTLYLGLAGGTMTGPITFAVGQTFPGVGTVTSVIAGTGLTGGTITTSGTIALNTTYTDGRYVQASSLPLPISQGGTGQTTRAPALNALLPAQASASGYILQSDGSNANWINPVFSFVTQAPSAPTASTDPGVQGQVASDFTYFYYYDGFQWFRIAWDTVIW